MIFSMKRISKYKIIYWSIGIIIGIWMNLGMFFYGSEGAIGPFILINLLAMPIAWALNLLESLIWPMISNTSPSILVTNIFILIILSAGYIQWFKFIPWVVRQISK